MFTEILWENIADIRHQIDECPFIQELGEGSLDPECFVFYLQNDWIYLNAFADALRVAEKLATTSKDKEILKGFAEDIATGEQELQERYFKLYQVNTTNIKLTTACQKYTTFLKDVSVTDDFASCVTALLPCFWIYADVGQKIFSRYNSENPYGEWIKTYASEDFDGTVFQMRDIVDRAVQDKNDESKAKYTQLFEQASLLEFHFWNDAYIEYQQRK